MNSGAELERAVTNCIKYLQIQTTDTCCAERKAGCNRRPVAGVAQKRPSALLLQSTSYNGPRFSV